MERWAQILIGTILSSVGLFVFYLIFEKFFKNFKGSQAKEVTNGVDRIQLRMKQVVGANSHEDREEMELLVYEEYDTEEHEVLAIVLENQSVTVGVSLFLSDRTWSITGPGSLNAAPVTPARRMSPSGAS